MDPAVTPRTRKQLAHLDPNHPLLDKDTFIAAMHAALPTDQAVLVRDLFRHMPPEARAALPAKNTSRIFLAAGHLLSVWKAHGPDGRRHLMIQRAELGPPPAGCGLQDCASREECVAQIQELLSHLEAAAGGYDESGGGGGGGGICGITQQKLTDLLRWDAVVGIRTHFGSLDAALKSYPQLFIVATQAPLDGSSDLVMSSVTNSVVFLRRN